MSTNVSDPTWPAPPGTVYWTDTSALLADGQILGQTRRLIVWWIEVHDNIRDPRTNEAERSMLVTWASEDNKPASEPFWITYYSHGWRQRDGGSITGQFGPEPPPGKYTPNDEKANSVEIMQRAYLKRVAEFAEHPGTRRHVWGTAEIAKFLGIQRSTWRAYVANGQAPPPDYPGAERNGWNVSTIREWHRNRPGPGTRTDLSAGPEDAQ